MIKVDLDFARPDCVSEYNIVLDGKDVETIKDNIIEILNLICKLQDFSGDYVVDIIFSKIEDGEETYLDSDSLNIIVENNKIMAICHC